MKVKSEKDATFMTFMGWVEKGRGVKKGEKAVAFVELTIDGVTKKRGLFDKSQTLKLKATYVDTSQDLPNYFRMDGYYGADADGLAEWDLRQLSQTRTCSKGEYTGEIC